MAGEDWRMRLRDAKLVLDVFERGVWCWACITSCMKKVSEGGWKNEERFVRGLKVSITSLQFCFVATCKRP